MFYNHSWFYTTIGTMIFCTGGQSSSKFFPLTVTQLKPAGLTINNFIISSVTEAPLLETEVNIIGNPIKQLERKKNT